MPNDETRWRPRANRASDGSKRLWIIAVVGVALLSALAFWGYTLNAPVKFSMPERKLPSPNAFDYYMKAADALVKHRRVIKPSAGLPGGIPAPGSPPFAGIPVDELPLNRNAATMAHMREGLKHSYVQPSSDHMSPQQRRLHWRDGALGELWKQDRRSKQARGDCAAALISCVDAIKFGSDICHGADTEFAGRGVRLEEAAGAPMWKLIPKVDASTARTAAERLARIAIDHPTYADGFVEEKRDVGNALARELNKPDWRGLFGHDWFLPNLDPHWPDWLKRPVTWAICVTRSRRKVMGNFTSYMDDCIAGASKPFALNRRGPDFPNDPVLVNILCPAYQLDALPIERVRTFAGLYAISLALRAYKLEHGKYPNRLDSLVPDYLDQLPSDPFGSSGSVHYRRKGPGYLLYSVGPDRKDDFGTPAIRPSVMGAPPSYYVDGSKGDIVAGISR